MTRKELDKVRDILVKIKQQDDPRVKEAIAYLDKDIALREQQKDNFKYDDSYDYSPY